VPVQNPQAGWLAAEQSEIAWHRVCGKLDLDLDLDLHLDAGAYNPFAVGLPDSSQSGFRNRFGSINIALALTF